MCIDMYEEKEKKIIWNELRYTQHECRNISTGENNQCMRSTTFARVTICFVKTSKVNWNSSMIFRVFLLLP